MRNRTLRAAAVSAVAALTLSACGDGGGGGGGDGEGFDAASEEIVRETDEKGGTLRFAQSSDFDSTDPANTYYAFSLNFNRLYSRGLTTYGYNPENANTAQPDLAEELGEPSDGNKTWTYTLREGLKYEDGSPVKAEHVKYAVMRTFDRSVLGNGPSYFASLIEGASDNKGPFKDKNWKAFKGIETPDDRTVIFHLNAPFAEFNEVVMFNGQTSPVPPEKDTGKQYALHPLSTGPYMWDGNFQPGKGGTLIRNPHWDAESDPNRKALPDKIVYEANVDAEEVDQRLLNGDIHVDMAGSGVQDNARKTILGDEALKSNADNPLAGFSWFIPITPVIDNVWCRRAIVYAADRDAMWRAYGGDIGGEFATNIQPPTIPGRETIEEVFPWDEDSPKAEDTLKQGYKGDVDKAKEALEECGKPNGFSTTMTFRSDRPKEKAVAQALQQALKRAGITLNLKGYPAATYTGEQFGSPDFVEKNGIGLGTYGWAADWPTGYGYLWALMAPQAIVPAGNTNIPEISDAEAEKGWADVVEIEDGDERAKVYADLERKALEEAYFLPNVWAKSLLFRPESLTNVYYHPGYGMYDYANMGVDTE